MRLRTLSLLSLVVLACGPAEDAPSEAAAPLADFAGTWQNEVMLQGTAEPVRSTMHAMATESGWTIDLEGRPGVVVHPSIVGDSLVTTTEPYESVLRPGVMVTVRSAALLQGDMMVGTVEATYQTPSGQEKAPGTFRSMRAP
jgi:hypothetical protein